MEVPKSRRIVDEDIKEKYRRRYCDVCGARPCDPAHVKSVGSGGNDEDYNLLSLCRQHHSEQHSLGFWKMCAKYPFFRQVLAQKGWEFSSDKKLRRAEHTPRFREKAFGKL